MNRPPQSMIINSTYTLPNVRLVVFSFFMTFTIGVGAALFGNISNGTGQALQKYSLNKINDHESNFSILKRMRDNKWVAGLVLTYLGEILNWYALVIRSDSF